MVDDDEFLSSLLPGAVIAGSDGAYHFTPAEAKDFMRLAMRLAGLNIHKSRLGRGTLLAREITRIRNG
jgi:hypothetical protein